MRTHRRRDPAPVGRTGSAGPVRLVAAAVALLSVACGDGSGPDPGRSIDVNLGVGDVQVERATGGEILRLAFPEGDGQEYRLAVQSAARTVGTTPIRLRAIAGSDGSGSISAALDRRVPPIYGQAALREHEGLRLRHRITQAAREELLRRRAVPARPGRRATENRLQAQILPSPSDTLEFVYAVEDDFGVSCDDTTAVITGTVEHVSDRVAFVEDTMAPGETQGGFTDMDYQQLGDEFDAAVFATDSAYFGGPADIDGNERVIVLFTPQVNLLTEENSDTFVGGFFIPTDLADSGDVEGDGESINGGACPTSNEAEILYLLSPDPNGDFNGNTVSVERARQNARAVSSHEFQHLLNAEQRVILGSGGFADLEELWLSEGLSHVAEEVVGLDLAGLALRDNLTFSDAVHDQASADLFNTFHISNFARLAHYMQDPTDTRAIAPTSDPGGFESLRMRGFAWIFARWLADQEAPSGDGVLPGAREQELFRELASGGPNHLQGIDNIERAARVVGGGDPTWEELLADFSAVLAVDDVVPGLPTRTTLLTWDLRSLFRGLEENTTGGGGSNDPFARPYPLAPTTNGFSNAIYDMDVQAGTSRYFTFTADGSHPALTIELTDQAGNALTSSAEAQITVVRVR